DLEGRPSLSHDPFAAGRLRPDAANGRTSLTKRTRTLWIGAAALGVMLSSGVARANPFEYGWHELAPGVWAAIREDPVQLPQGGKAVVVVTDHGVVLFDAGGSPAMGEAIVAKVRSLTDRPITDVVLSHWHGDHMRGLQAIVAAFPSVRILAHPTSRDWIVSTQ